MISTLFLSKFTRILVSSALVMSAAAALAQSAPPPAAGPGKNFEEHKQKELARIEHHLQMMQALQSCVQAATNHDEIKSCNDAAKTGKSSEH